MRTTHVLRASVYVTLLSFFLLPAAGHAQPCNAVVGTTVYSHINDALGAVGNGPGTITVTGTCPESVQINNARSITIVAGPGGASIVEPNDNDAFEISLSQGIFLENLDISTTGPDAGGVVITDASEVHINGCNIHGNKAVGVNADTGSILFLRHSTIEKNNPNDGLDVYDSIVDVAFTSIQNNGSSGPNGGIGVFVSRNSVATFRQQNFILNNADVGIQAANLSSVYFQSDNPANYTTVQGHNVNGIFVGQQSRVQINGASPQVIEGNGASCPLDPTCGGIFAFADSTVGANNVTITGNHGSGISASQGTNLHLSGATVSNNTGAGVYIQWISTGFFVPGSGTTITGNGGKSVFCDTTSLAAGDLSGFTNIGCNQIARSIGPPRPGRER